MTSDPLLRMESPERLAVRRGMNELKPYLAAYVAQQGRNSVGSDGGDVAALLRVFVRDWEAVYSRQLPRVVRSYVHELIDIRNRWAHESDFSSTEVTRAIDTMKQLAAAIGAPVPAAKPAPSTRVGKMPSQRATMREIYARLRGNEERIVGEYATFERNGKVQRAGTKSGLSPEEYARALLNDGLKKGWLL